MSPQRRRALPAQRSAAHSGASNCGSYDNRGMKIHAVLSSDAQQLLRGQSADSLNAEGHALLGRLQAAGVSGINLPRALRHGIVSGELPDAGLAQLRAMPEVATVEIDGVMRAL